MTVEARSRRYSGGELLEFIQSRMSMSSPYQPLLIRALIESGGRASADDLAKVLLLADSFAVARARSILMRWPRATLGRHGVARYDRASREFVLEVEFESDQERADAVAACTEAVDGWSRKDAPRAASRFFAVIERAGGRCEACGVLAAVRPIDVDHIVPRARARGRKVRTADGQVVDVDDPRNLQALCARCNRGKRDASTADFRLTGERLSESMLATLEKAASAGIDPNALLSDVSEAWVARAAGPEP